MAPQAIRCAPAPTRRFATNGRALQTLVRRPKTATALQFAFSVLLVLTVIGIPSAVYRLIHTSLFAVLLVAAAWIERIPREIEVVAIRRAS
jgi:hypothetical protein